MTLFLIAVLALVGAGVAFGIAWSSHARDRLERRARAAELERRLAPPANYGRLVIGS